MIHEHQAKSKELSVRIRPFIDPRDALLVFCALLHDGRIAVIHGHLSAVSVLLISRTRAIETHLFKLWLLLLRVNHGSLLLATTSDFGWIKSYSFSKMCLMLMY